LEKRQNNSAVTAELRRPCTADSEIRTEWSRSSITWCSFLVLAWCSFLVLTWCFDRVAGDRE